MEIFLSVLSGVCVLGALFIGYYFHIKKVVESELIDAINHAEDTDKKAKEKLEEAVKFIYNKLPESAKLFVTEGMLRIAIQKAFDKIEEFVRKQNKK